MSLWKGLSIALVALVLIAGGTLVIWKQMTKNSTPPARISSEPHPQVPPPPDPAKTAVPSTTDPLPAFTSLMPLLKPSNPSGAPLAGIPGAGTPVPGQPAAGASIPGQSTPGTAPSHASVMELTAEQKEKMHSIDVETQKKIDAIRKDPKLSDEDKNASILVAMQEAQLQADDLLTPEQRAQREQAVEKGRAALAKKYHLTPQQVQQQKAITDSANDRMRAILRDTKLSDKEKFAELIKVQTDTAAQYMKMLTPTQRKQLEKEEQQRQEAARAAAGPTVEDLHLTADQQAKIKAIREEAGKKLQALSENKKLTDKELKTQYIQIMSDCDAQIMKVLTPEQQQQLNDWAKNAARKAEGKGGKK